MKFLFMDNGKPCAAKTVYMIAFAVCMFKIIFAGVAIGSFAAADPNYAGMAAFLTPLAGAYGWRTQSKAGDK